MTEERVSEMEDKSEVWWHMPIIPGTPEAGVGLQV